MSGDNTNAFSSDASSVERRPATAAGPGSDVRVDRPGLRWRPIVVEGVASFVYVFLSAAAFASASFMGAGGGTSLLGLALAHGLAIAAACVIATPVSGGHVTPVVTLATAIEGRLPAERALAVIAAQAGAAWLGILFAAQLMPVEAFTATQGGAALLAPGVGLGRALGLALLIGAFVGLAGLATRGVARAGALGAITVASFFGLAPLVGEASNPARVFAAAIHGEWPDGTLALVVGALMGAVLAGAGWRMLHPRD